MHHLAELNHLAVLTAALASFLIGGLWYGPLFGKTWMRAWGLTEADLQKGHPALIYGGAFILMVIAAAVLDTLGGGKGWLVGLHWGLLGGIGFAITANGVDYLFERRSLLLFAVNGGYKLVTFALMGVIVGVWEG